MQVVNNIYSKYLKVAFRGHAFVLKVAESPVTQLLRRSFTKNQLSLNIKQYLILFAQL
jgi:hypothetical protein